MITKVRINLAAKSIVVVVVDNDVSEVNSIIVQSYCVD